MTTTFQKRQKEMKRLDKQKAKQERRAQRKLEKRAEKDSPTDPNAVEVTTEAEVPDPQGTA